MLDRFSPLRVLAALAVVLWIAAPASAKNGDIDGAIKVVELLYEDHGRRFNAFEEPVLNAPEAAGLYFVDALVRDGLQGELGFDPIYNAQDADVSALSIGEHPETPILRGAAQVEVKLTNFGRPQTFVYTLVRSQSKYGWQISDIYSEDDGWSLAELVSKLGR